MRRGPGRAGQVATVHRVIALAAALIVLSSPAAAAVVRGPAGSLELPDQIGVATEPANQKHPNPTLSIVQRLTIGSGSEAEQATLTQTCSPGIGGLNSRPGIERLASATLMINTNLKLRKPGEWTQLDSHPAYLTELSGSNGALTTQWMVPLPQHFAWIKFERGAQSSMEQDVLASVERMQLLCGAAAVDPEN